MPRGDKSAYTDKQARQAQHIEESYEHRGVASRDSNFALSGQVGAVTARPYPAFSLSRGTAPCATRGRHNCW
jgi:hypothetical protein